MKTNLSERVLGVFTLGHENVRLVLRPGLGGDFDTAPDDKGACIIRIGGDTKSKFRLISVLLHEVLEVSLHRLHARMAVSTDFTNSSDTFIFHMDHNQFSMACAMSADFITPALPVLEKAWRKWHRDKKALLARKKQNAVGA